MYVCSCLRLILIVHLFSGATSHIRAFEACHQMCRARKGNADAVWNMENKHLLMRVPATQSKIQHTKQFINSYFPSSFLLFSNNTA